MSHSQAKRLRVSLRIRGVPVGQTAYTMGPVSFRLVPDPQDASKVRRVPITGTVSLDPACGRAEYRALKRAARGA